MFFRGCLHYSYGLKATRSGFHWTLKLVLGWINKFSIDFNNIAAGVLVCHNSPAWQMELMQDFNVPTVMYLQFIGSSLKSEKFLYIKIMQDQINGYFCSKE